LNGWSLENEILNVPEAMDDSDTGRKQAGYLVPKLLILKPSPDVDVLRSKGGGD
jgi:hypothetical protein